MGHRPPLNFFDIFFGLLARDVLAIGVTTKLRSWTSTRPTAFIVE